MQMKYPAYRKNTENTYPSSWGWNLEFRSTQSLYTKNSFPDILLILSFFQSIRSGIRNSGHRNFKRDRHRMNTDENERKNILDELLPTRGEGAYLQGPIYFDYGIHTSLGKSFYVNSNFTVLDVCRVTIGDNCWIAGNVTILAGSKIGSGCVIGVGSVVSGEIPDHSVAYGVPCRVARAVTDLDGLEYHRELF